MNIEIISIGDEILSGNILDTNKQFLSDALWQQGFKVKYHTSVCDDEADIRDALLMAAGRADVVLCTGGLGPTVDDFTVEVAAKTFATELIPDQQVLAYLEGFFKKRGRVITDNNRRQALVFKDGRAFVNKEGMAPGLFYQFKKTRFYFFPGVPREMQYLFKEHVLPELFAHRTDARHFRTVFLNTFGTPESELDNRLKDLFHHRTHIQNARVGFRAHFPEVTLKISVWGDDEVLIEKDLNAVVQQVYDRVGEFIYAEGQGQSLAGTLVERLKILKKTMAVAESCTGGQIADTLTDIPGVSEVLVGGVVSYSNDLKVKILHVDKNIIAEHGAVSPECALAMVEGIHALTRADYCVAVTGIAGPGGGTADKPVGTVFIATRHEDKPQVKKLYLPFSREKFKKLVTTIVMKDALDALA